MSVERGGGVRSGVIISVLVLASASSATGQGPAWVQIEDVPGRFAVVQTETRVPSAGNFLQAALECYQKRDFEQADLLLRRAEADVAHLTEAQQRLLRECWAANQTALTERRQALALYAHAKRCFEAGRLQDAQACLLQLQHNAYLKPEELAQVRDWLETANGERSPEPMPECKGGNALAAPGPAGNGREGLFRTTDALLQEARRALQQGDFQRAEVLAQQAETAGSGSWLPWADQSRRLQKEIEQARSLTGRELLRQARSAVRGGDLRRARHLLLQAESVQPKLSWWDDLHPDRIRAELAAAETRALQSTPSADPRRDPRSAGTARNPSVQNALSFEAEDARQLTALARQNLQAGRLDEAETLARQASRLPGTRWSLFGPTPEQILAQIAELRSRNPSAHATPASVPVESIPPSTTATQQMPSEAQVVEYVAMPPLELKHQDSNPSPDGETESLEAAVCALQSEGRLLEAFRLLETREASKATPIAEIENLQRLREKLHREAVGQFDACLAIADRLQEQGRFAEAEHYLLHARQLAIRFAWPTYAVNQKLVRLKVLTDEAEHAVRNAPEEARQHLAAIAQEAQAGRITEARKLAEALYTAPYGLKLQASSWLARLDALEFAGSRQDAERHYELAVQAFVNKDFEGAALYLAAADLRLLDSRRQAHAAELLRTLQACRFQKKAD